MSNMGFNSAGVFGSILNAIKDFKITNIILRKAHIKTQTPGSTVNVRTSPNGAVCASVKDGAAVTVISSAKGSDGYIWYKISSPPGYVRGDFVSFEKSPVSLASTLAIDNVSIIPNITQGTPVSISGTISSNYDITSVTVGVYSDDGITHTEAKASPFVKSYNISTLDALVKFGNAKAGTNYFSVTATDASGTTKTLVNQQFTVSPKTGAINSVSEFKNKYGETINKQANELGIDPNLLAAVILVESSGSGFADGKLLIRFENHCFIDRTTGYEDLFSFNKSERWKEHKFRTSIGDEWKDVHTDKQSSEYEAFNFAKKLNEEAAFRSISMGLGQIMGFNYATCGYGSAKEMFDDFSKGDEQQLIGLVQFIKNYNSGKTLKALQDNDLSSFVTQYNGPGQVEAYTKLILDNKEAYLKA